MAATPLEPPQADLVLVGGGHAHVQVLRRLMMRPLRGVRITVVLDRPEAIYSGMVPGFVAGDYELADLTIDVVPLARRARARVVLAPAVRIDAEARRVLVEGRPPLTYDVASVDVGSTVRGLELPGVREHALATRPIGAFAAQLDARVAAAGKADGPLTITVVGAGAAGLELGFTLAARLRAAGRNANLRVVSDGASVLPGYPANVVRRATTLAQARGIEIVREARAIAVHEDGIELERKSGGPSERLSSDLVVWATGAAPLPLLSISGLPTDERGFLRVADTLEVEGAPGLFAAGDCASLVSSPWVPKAGVYAVRQGPYLARNLERALAGRKLRRYKPQRDFLALLHLGEGRALGAKWGLRVEGRSVLRLKDAIDRRFMRRFQVLTEGRPATGFPSPESMGMEEMPCGGCAAKVAASPLERALARLDPPLRDESVRLGLESPDDAAWVAVGGGSVLATVDGFRAFTEDPWLVGRVAAVNAVSDVHAKGGLARHALAWVTLPELEEGRSEEELFQVLQGIRATLDRLDVPLVGGHSTVGPELFVGLTVLGEAGPHGPIPLDGARAGDVLLLTQPLGTGVLLAADMQGRATGAWVERLHAMLLRDNAAAARVAREHQARAATDVSGFGLAGHLGELARASGVCARLELGALPALPGARALLRGGLRSTFHESNAQARRGIATKGPVEASELELLFDPQTSGGLLLALPPERAAPALEALHAAGDTESGVVGRLVAPRADGAWIEALPSPRG